MNKEEIIKRALIILHTTGYTNELEKSLCIDAIEQLQQENKQLKERIDKAIEYLESYNLDFARCKFGEAPISIRELNDLLEILKGDNND